MILSWNLYPPVHFLCMWLSGTIAISNSDSASPCKIPHWIFTSVKCFPPAVTSTRQFFIFSINLKTSSDILYILRQSIIQLCGIISYAFLKSIHHIFTFFRFVLLFVLFPCRILSVLRRTVGGLLANSKSPPWFALLIFSPSSVGTL